MINQNLRRQPISKQKFRSIKHIYETISNVLLITCEVRTPYSSLQIFCFEQWLMVAFFMVKYPNLVNHPTYPHFTYEIKTLVQHNRKGSFYLVLRIVTHFKQISAEDMDKVQTPGMTVLSSSQFSEIPFSECLTSGIQNITLLLLGL